MNIRGFEFPDDLYYQVEHQTWARLNADGSATVGITALGIRLSGEIYMCRPKSVGQLVEQGRSVAVVELAKAIVAVKSPLSGSVLEINALLAERPELVHLDPYGQGWIVRLAPSSLLADQGALIHGADVVAAMEHHAWLNQVE